MSNNNGYSMPQPNYNQGPPPNRGPPQQNMNRGPPPQQNMNRGPPPPQNVNRGPPPPQNMNRGPPPPQNMNMGPPPQNMNRPISPRSLGSAEFLAPNNYNPQSSRQNSTYSTISGSMNFSDSSMQLLPGSNSSLNQGYQPVSSGPSPIMQRPASPMGQRPPSPNPNNPNSRIKKIQLYKGNYIVNCPVPDGVLRKGVFGRDIEEFGYLRYSAVTCDPNDFEKSNFTLRQCFWKRQTELFIVLTMYNEDEILFARSMSSVMENITYMCNKDKKWGMDGWKKVIVCIVSDGRKKINDRVLNMLEFMGVYQEGVMKERVNDKEVQAHLFEYTTQIFLDTKMNDKGATDNYLPVQLLFCLKEKNKKKINSHRWFFNAFGRILKPNVCVLIDVGTRPTSTSIHSLWKAFDKDKQIAGACGEIKCDLGKHWKNLLNPLVATQHFEYKMSNILDKPLESIFGYISVLPGAFSAYRFSALQGQPLEAYFKGETLHERPDGSLFKSNMYLAEDRILCFELVAKKGANYVLKYVRSAKAETDVPDNIPEFISQRRRWLNGSFFASLYSTYNWMEVYRTEHSLFRKIIFAVEFVYNIFNLLFSWFGLANFFLTFYFLASMVKKNSAKTGITFLDEHGDRIFLIMETIYAYALICIFICSLGNRPQGSRLLYLACIILFAIVMLDNSNVVGMFFSLLATYGIYFISSFLHLQPAHMFTSFIQYMLLLPSFVNILMVYAFCNTHDVSWGTKGSTDDASSKLGSVSAKPGDTIHVELPSKDNINSHYEKLLPELRKPKPVEVKSVDSGQAIQDGKQNFRTYMVLFWIFCNSLLLIFCLTVFNENYLLENNNFNPYLTFIFYSVLFLSAVRFVGSTFNEIN
ncbi:glycosyltransferase family 2 protein [Piromyces sp. E2]|nr:glycosyltransferase family 2 protein [Piromyces sp. E2]|eukprot:OUM68694.1 glycosyltransferase family 2 protein [Piromyces sp. E2]